MKIFLLRLIRVAWYFFATVLVLVAVLVSLAHLMTPLLNKHRRDLEVWASALLQVPITIGELHADWRGNIPELTLTQVVTLDKVTHQPVFDMQEIKFGFQLFTSLWKRKVVLQDITISGAEVTVLQDASGGYAIKDLPVQPEKDYQSYKLTSVLSWFFSQPYLALRNIEVHFLPYKGEKHELDILKVALVNQGDQHKINGSFLLQQELPTEIKARIEWQGQVTDPDHIKAQAYLNLEGLSLGQWLQGNNPHLKTLFSGWQIHQGLGGIDFWLKWENKQLQEVQSVFQWYGLEFYSILDKRSYPIEHLSGHVGWKRDGLKQIFAGDNLLISFPKHLWPASTFYVVLTPNLVPLAKAEKQGEGKLDGIAKLEAKKAGKKPSKKNLPVATDSYSEQLSQGLAIAEEGVKQTFATQTGWRVQELHIGYLNLQDLMPILAANSSLPETLRKNLLVLDPLGELRNLVFSWKGGLTDLAQTSFSGEFRHLIFNPWRNYPGLGNLSGSLKWNGSEGQVEVNSKELLLAMPAFFATTLAFDEVKTEINFQHNEEAGWLVKIKKAVVSNEQLSLKTTLQVVFPPKGSPSLDLNATFSLSQATQVAHYLPAKIMDPDLVSWLKAAFLSGRLDSGSAVIRGKLSEFPFDKSDPSSHSLFEVSSELKEVDFYYAPQWPLLQQVSGNLLFSGRSMKATLDSALIMAVPLKQVRGVIPYLGADKPQTVKVQATVDTDLAKALEFIHQSPLEQVIGKDLGSLALQGPINLDLALSIPLTHPDQATILGKVQLKQGILGLPEWNLTLDQLHGAFQFTEKGLSAKSLQGLLWGEPTSLQLATVSPAQGKPSYVDARVVGKFTIPHLQAALKLPLSNFLAGTANYQAQLKLYQSGTTNNEVYLSSDLQGLTVDLPAPYGKPAALRRKFALNFLIQQAPGFKTQLSYGDFLQANLAIMLQQNARLIDIDSAQLKGRVKVAYPFDAKRPIEAQLERLIVKSGNEKTISSIDPSTVPPLQISSRQFFYDNKNLGQLSLNTMPKPNGLTIQNFNLSTGYYSFQSRGQWVMANKVQQSQLQGTIESGRVNKFLESLGFSQRNLVVDKGRAAFDLQWRGAPYSFSLGTTSGDFSFALERGRIINLNQSDNNKMDMGRMLSLFSLQTIPRRLSLDFSDLFEQGYSFDFMRGDFSLRQGSAFTQKPTVIEGPVARVVASGRIGLLAQDYDLNLSISPHVTESLPVVAGALTLNPFVGAAAWVVNKMVLSKEVSKVITYNYKVTGSWDAPVWQSVQKGKR